MTEEAIQLELEYCIPKNYSEMSDEDKVFELLGTACGAEFMFERDEDLCL